MSSNGIHKASVKEIIQLYLQELSAVALGKPVHSIDIIAGFFDLGMDSKMTMQLVTSLEDKVGQELYPTLLFEYQNIEDLSIYLLENYKEAFTNQTIEKPFKVEVQPKETTVIHTAKAVTKETIQSYLQELSAQSLEKPVNTIDVAEGFFDLGMDSKMTMQLVSTLEDKVGHELYPTLLFEYQNIEDLSIYLLENDKQAFSEVKTTEVKENTTVINTTKVETKITETTSEITKTQDTSLEDDVWGDLIVTTEISKTPETLQVSETPQIPKSKEEPKIEYKRSINDDAVAIVGLSGRYPQAKTIAEFWENLKQGKDCVTEVPKDRWDVDAHFDTEKGKEGKTYSKWGGFIDDADKFDPLFFGMSPIAAENMDPQARIFLEESWKTIEDAGYNPAKLSESYKVGVFAGVFWTDYQLYRLDKSESSPSSFVSTVANMTSFYLGLRGPSIGLDTQCSSSLTAIHLACESIRRSECDVALAGGVNLSVHSSKYNWLSNARFLSDRGKCEAFGEGGNGYVPAEGVGTILLKRLSDAERDGDRIYGVIKGEAINHGGKSSGLTVPNLNAQAEVIKDAMKKAGIKPEDYSYVEAHGTGTSLGDPIEIAGLNKAFNNAIGQYCAIGSVKSNIGHAESAAGIAGFTKVLLQLQHKQIVPSIHSSTLNSNIKFEKTAFTVPQELQDWNTAPNNKRIAGLSSFGAGGSNAHIIIEEYVNPVRQYNSNVPAIIVLSAKNTERLEAQAKNILEYLETNTTANIYDIAYTLQVGRQAMEERLACLVNDVSDLKTILSQYLNGQRENLLLSNVSNAKNSNSFILKGNAGKAYIETAIREQEVDALIQLWMQGIEIDWNLLYNNNNKPNKISLPTYPFARERYWVAEARGTMSNAATVSKLHPLVHTNNSTLAEQKYTTVLTGNESFLRDHKVEGEKILPGVAYLEWAREAGARSLSTTITQLKNVTWLQPITVNSNAEKIQINLFEEDNGYGYEIYSPATFDRDEVIYGQGTLNAEEQAQPSTVDVETLKASFSSSKSGQECYTIFKDLGFDYGNTFRGIKTLYFNETASLSEITLEEDYNYVLQPGILDSALQSILGISLAKEDIVLNLPFSTKEVTIYNEVQKAKWCHVKQSDSYKVGDKVVIYDINILSETGAVLLEFKDLTTLPVKKSVQPKATVSTTKVNEDFGLQTYTTHWKSKAIDSESKELATEHIVLVAGGSVDLGEKLKDNLVQEVIVLNEPTEIAYYNRIQDIVKPLLGAKQTVGLTLVYNTEEYIDYAFVSGLLKTAQLESRKLITKTIGVEHLSINTVEELAETIRLEQNQLGDEVRYIDGDRQERLVASIKETQHSGVAIKDNGVYLITGGSGGLGKIFAGYIAENKSTKLILSGRSTVSKLSDSELKALNATYYSCDVTDKNSVEYLIQTITKEHGALNGIIHSAGVIADSFLIKKTAEEATKVLQPKINGVKFLDHATRDLKLDFTVYFSSMAAVTGNFGQSDYASGNTWLDYYAVYRNTLEKQGKRSGHTLSINWPLWKDGGMKMDAESEKYVKQKWGMSALPTAEGILALETLLKNKTTQGVIAYGERKKIHSKLVGEEEILEVKETTTIAPVAVTTATTNTSDLSQSIENEVFALISSILKLDANRINKEKGFGDYGFDSVMMINLVQVLNEKYDGLDLAPTALINYTTISEFLEFLLEDHGTLFQTADTSVSETKTTETIEVKDQAVAPKTIQVSKRHKKIGNTNPTVEAKTATTMAIVAMNGRFSSIKTEDELWHNTAENLQLNLASETTSSHVAYSKIDLKNVEENWSVLNMDTSEIKQLSAQEKLIFEVLSNAMSHYKIDRKTLASKTTGVFIAAQEYAEEEHQTLAYLIPNKVSYHLNLKGPSELVNTYCTSSYVAIHRAIQSIVSGECKQAIVGGVNLVSKEEMDKAVASDFGGLFSKKGDTKSFSENAEGFVRSEGVGVIIIKPLEDAELDNDTILGLIKGSSVSHGGKGFSIEAPNAKGLKKAIEESILKANVPIDTIDYVEAHGIANRMADAIELSAIDTVYKKFSKNPDKKWHIGTSKPVVGHSELASGMASIIKVLKAFEHKTIPGIAGLGTINSELDPNHSLVLTTEASYWKNGKHPRRAGLNSYAVGGVNAHLILEEYPNKTITEKPFKKEKEEVVAVVKDDDVVPVQETIREEIEAISNDIFKIATADFDETLSPIDYDFDSIKVIELVNRINEHFDVTVKMGQILGADDFKSMFDVFETIVVKSKSATTDNIEIEQETAPEYFPLSEGQKGLWFIQNKNPESTEYNVPVGFSIENEIDTAVIYKAAEHLLEKHPTLRVSFFTDEEEGAVKQEVKSASGYLKEDVKTISEAIATEFKILQSIPFELSENVTKLYIRKDAISNKTYVLFMVHHIVFDGSSVEPFVSNFKGLLNQLQSGISISHTTEDRSYFDFINQEQDYLKGKDSTEDFKFWNEKMSGTIEAIALPYSNTKTEQLQTIDQEGISSIELSGTVLTQLKTVAKANKVNLSILMLAIFKVLLHRLTSAEDVIVKTPIAGRLNEKFAKSVGYYINMMLTRTSILGGDSFTEVIQKVKTEFLANIDYAKYPYAKLLTELEATKGKGDTLFSIVYTYQNIFGAVLDQEDNANIKVVESLKQNAVEDYSLEVVDLKDSVTINLKFLKTKFTEETINAHLDYYKNIIDAVVDNPENKVNDINILTEEERQKLVTEFNATETTYPKNVTIVDLFETQVKQTPNAIAVTYLNDVITYKTLDERSKQLAIYLVQKGVKADTLVGLCMERSIEMVVAILGVLRAGGAYVPIAPDYPQDRIKYMVEDGIVKGNAKENLKLIIAQTTLETATKALIEKAGATLEALAPIWEQNKRITTVKGELKTKPALHNLAYVIYTSGSTGKPKGVLIEHSNFADLIQYQKQYFEVDENDQFIQFSNFSFDASGEQIYLPLVSGGTLNIVPRADLLDIDKFKTILVDKGITHLHAVPSFLGEIPFIPNTKLKRIISGGDVFDHRVLENWGNKGIRIIDKYGPTETTVSAIQRDLEFPLQNRSIGKPLGDTTCYVVDKANNLQPIGVAGELCIGGTGLSRGYLNQPELTQEKFIKNPFGYGKIYKTGDLVRWTPEGNIDFLGRIDQQVKINGFRIELGEVETAINTSNLVDNSTVIAKEHTGSKQLVAYCVFNTANDDTSISELKAQLSQALPDYMVPTYIIAINELPLTPNQKIDRKALLAKPLEVNSEAQYVAPRTKTEEALAEIWQTILKVNQVGSNDNFFELGGHSLLITKLLSEIKKTFKIKLELSKIYEAPTLKQLAKTIGIGDDEESDYIPVISNRENAVLSFAQQRLWFLAELGQGEQYHIPELLRIKGDVDVSILERSLNYLLSRHESLRTVFRKNEQGEAFQYVEKEKTIQIIKEDYSNLTPVEKESQLRTYSKAFIDKPFDLSNGPLIRATVVKLAEAEFVFGLCIHHIIADGWSLSTFRKELNEVYSSYINEESIVLPSMPIQYIDYAAWEQNLFKQDSFSEGLAHWKMHLDNHKDVLVLTDFPRPKQLKREGKRINKVIDVSTKTQLATFNKTSGATLFTSLLTSVFIVLNKYSGQDDICIGIPAANRSHRDTEKLIGFFVNTLVNRLQFKTNETVLDVFNNVQKELIRSQQYQHIPFDKVVEAVKPTRETNVSPLFQVMVNYLKKEDGVKLGNSATSFENIDYDRAKFDLTIDFIDTQNDGLILSINYNTELFEANTIERITNAIQYVLTNLVTQSNTRLEDFSLVTQEDKLLLNEFNNTATNYPKQQTIYELFEAQVEQTPNAEAIVFEDEVITYKELDTRSKQLALYLQEQGVEQETFVGICMERSLEMMVAIFGVLRAGGAYVPIDPGYPKDRINYMLTDSIVEGNGAHSVKLLLTQEHLKATVLDKIDDTITTITLAKQWQDNTAILDAMGTLKREVTSRNLAYVIYTSGSTGKPKGVMVEHSSVIRLIKNTAYYEFSENDTLISTGAFSFDATIFEFFGPLLNGGKLILAAQSTLLNNQLLAKTLADNEANIMFITSSWLNQLIDTDIELFSPLKTILTGGERISPTHIGKLKSTFEDLRTINCYGPTENTTFSTTFDIEEIDGDIPIGAPISNDKVHIVNTQHKLQPIGVPGELCLAGDGIARGYLNRPELTQEKFIDNPFGEGKLYKTGDLARWKSNGQIEFLGRIDSQVKLRGFRIELGEIETLLNTQDNIQNSTVIVKDHLGTKQLIGYCVLVDKTKVLDGLNLKQQLSERLPEYMVPTFILDIEVLPLTPNGKVDRKALQNLEVEFSGLNEYVAPQTETEKGLAKIWEVILGVEQIGVTENFFELGGHSLLVTKLLSRINKVFNINLELATVYETPVLQQLAQKIANSTETVIPEITVVEDRSRLPLSFAQQRLWFLAEMGQSERYHIPGLLTVKGTLDVDLLEKSINHLVSRHDTLRTSFRKDAQGVAYQHIEDEVNIKIEREHYTKLNAKQKALKIAERSEAFVKAPFDLSQGPLLRLLVIETAKDDYVLGLCMHHIISDGWSLNIMVNELNTIYSAYRKGETVELAPLPIQYGDYAVWQRDLFASNHYAQGLAHWKNHLTGYSDLELPTDYTRPKIATGAGEQISITLDAKVKAQLNNLSITLGGTLFTGLLTSVYILLNKYSGQDDICIGLPAANRGHNAVEHLIGFFVNTLVNRLHLNNEASLENLFKTVQKELIRSQEYQDIPFNKIVEAVQPERQTSKTPIFQVMVNYVQLNTSLELGDAEVARVEQDGSKTAKFDLSFSFIDHGSASLKLALDYNTDIYSSITAHRLLSSLVRIISSLSDAIDTPLQQYNILEAKEEAQLLTSYNATTSPYDTSQLIHEQFEVQAQQNPKATAVICGDVSLSYQALDNASNQLAHYLQAHYNITRGTLIGVKLERNETLIISLLAILKTGAAYVPLDINYPEERIAYIEQDSKSALILDDEIYANYLSKQEDYNTTKVKSKAKATDKAYIIYTSGTTGKPKGVMISHNNATALIHWASQEYSSADFNTVYAATSHCFDLSIYEMFYTLSVGKTIRVLNNALDIASYLDQDEKVVINTVPSSMRTLLDEGVDLSSVSIINLAGEPFPIDIAKQLQNITAEVRNLYGPSEDTTYSTHYKLSKTKDYNTSIPIGRPIANTQAYILDNNYQLVPNGAIGTLYLSGDGVTQGYLNKADLTAERYVVNPFKEESTMYDTGDLARWLPDGTIEYLGRKDNQVKVRGYRIELGEIENTLNTITNIKESVVIAKDHLGSKQIAAYCVLEDNATLEVEAIKQTLAISLPDYMVPSFIQEIEAIPLTPNGKTDRKQLERLALTVESTTAYVAPQTETEKTLAVIWSNLLEVDTIGVYDNFFELGGHSLLVMRLLSKIQQEFNVKLELSKVFDTPVLQQLAQKIANSTETVIPAITVVEDRSRLPLSFAQQRLWFLAEMGQSERYHVPGLLTVKGTLNVDLLEKSINYLVSRHDTLRTTFRKDAQGVAYQHIEDEVNIKIEREHYTKLNTKQKALKIAERSEAFVKAPFDLSQGPLLRLLVIETAKDDYVLGLCMHHIISDGWSLNIMVNELNTIYSAYRKGETVELAPLPIQYGDYAVWQRDLFASNHYAQGLAHWKNHLTGYNDLELPTDYTRPKIATGAGEQISITLDAKVKAQLNNLSITLGGTLFTGLLTSVYILLNKYSGQDDICIGLPVANRGHNAVEHLIGFFVNTLVNRLHLNNEASLENLFKTVQKELIRSQEYQDIPFNKIVEAVQPERQTSKTPIFQVMVNYVQLNTSLELGDAEVARVEQDGSKTAKFDLSFSFIDHGSASLKLALDYNTDIYSNTTANRLLSSLVCIISSLVEAIDTPLQHFNILEAKEEVQLLTTYNATTSPYDASQLIHEQFEIQAQQNPKATAVVCGDISLSYQALDDASNQLAHYLQANYNITRGTLIGVKLERNETLIISLLAILKTGAAYVPLDVNYPKERIAYIEQDSNSELILDATIYADYLNTQKDYKTTKVKSKAKATDNAYIIYTSGTTGKPKGVMISHNNATALIHWASQEYNSADFNTVYAATSHCFDLSIYEMFYTLSVGKTIRVLNNALDIASYLGQDEKVVINTVPSSMRTLLDEGVDLSNVSIINLAGEPFPIDIAKQLQNTTAEVRNLYGPSEDTTYSTHYKLSKTKDYNTSIPIGRPIANTQAYILDNNYQLVPNGAIGTLYLSGDGVTQGYLNKADLTAERYVANPFKEESTMYDTGDLARWLPDGTIEYLGRKDNQVKVRGYRIELGEIENTLNTITNIKESVVIAKDHLGSKQIAAYCVLEDNATLEVEAIKQHLAISLTDYMVPSFILEIEAIPLTPNGKTDRKHLESLALTVESTTEYVAPQTETEQVLALIWSNLLEVETVGIHDSFFELGGHSLLTVQLIQKINSTFKNKKLELIDVVSLETIHKQAILLDNLSVRKTSQHLVNFNRKEVQDTDVVDTFIIPGMTGIAEGYYELAASYSKEGDNVYGIQMYGLLEGEVGYSSIEDMAKHNIDIIKSLPCKTIRLVSHSYGGVVVFEMVKQLLKESITIKEVTLLDSYLPKASLRVKEKAHIFIVTMLNMLNIEIDEKDISKFVGTILKKAKKDRVNFIYEELKNKGGKIEKTFFIRLYTLCYNALSISYKVEGQMDEAAVLVIAKQVNQKNAQINQDWSPYFKTLQVVESTGSHFEIVKEPFIGKWKNDLKNKQ